MFLIKYIINIYKGVNMELREINTFITITQVGSFTKAAAKLGYTQAAVTVQMSNLEKELNTKLFDRIGKGIKLTNQGEIFNQHAIRILNEVTEATEAVTCNKNLTGTLLIGAVDSVCSRFLSKILQKFNEQYPNVTVTIFTETPAVLFEKLLQNDFDILYILDEKVTDNKFTSVLEIEEEVVFTCGKNHRLASSSNIEMSELLESPFVLTESDASYRKVLDKCLGKNDIEIEPIIQTKNTELICQILENNLGVSVLPKFVIERYLNEGKLTILDVEVCNIPVYRQVIHHKNKWVTREMKAFIDLVQEEM